MNAARLDIAAVSYHARYLEAVAEIERQFPVALWSSGDVGLWPLARLELHADMYWANLRKERPAAQRSRLPRLAWPAKNLWLSRKDLAHWVARPRRAHAIFLGDGVSLDRVDGAWRDRFGEPIFRAFEQQGLDTFIMQSGGVRRLPWQRPTFAANVLETDGAYPVAKANLPAHADVIAHLRREGIASPALNAGRLAALAHSVSATASRIERVLQVVQPKLAFVVTWYSGLGPSFLLACRRRRVLSIDLQHCPQEGTHKAYGWSAVPPDGYGTLPAVFWNWTAREAQDIQSWARALPLPWHRGLHGGHTQLAQFMDDSPAWDQKFAVLAGPARYEREILIALQPIGGHRKHWQTLAQQVATAPPAWRWWIRRHPSSGTGQDEEYRELLALNRPNVLIDEAAALPLPALLRHMSASISLASGAAAEAAALGIPSFFLSEEARVTFPRLANVIAPTNVNDVIAQVATQRPNVTPLHVPPIHESLRTLTDIAADYRRL